MLKVQLHCHTKGDLLDNVKYTPKELLKEAARLNYDVVAITAHRKVIFSKTLKRYAEKLGILLIPGIEFEVNGKHTLGINVDSDIEKVKNLEDLRNYRETHPDSLIIAAHPFFYPKRICHQEQLTANLELFDAIENSWCYTKNINFNKKALALAKKANKPIIATADCHVLRHLDIGYSYVDSPKNTKQIIEAIKQGKIEGKSQPQKWWQLLRVLFDMWLMEPIAIFRMFRKH